MTLDKASDPRGYPLGMPTFRGCCKDQQIMPGLLWELQRALTCTPPPPRQNGREDVLQYFTSFFFFLMGAARPITSSQPWVGLLLPVARYNLRFSLCFLPHYLFHHFYSIINTEMFSLLKQCSQKVFYIFSGLFHFPFIWTLERPCLLFLFLFCFLCSC